MDRSREDIRANTAYSAAMRNARSAATPATLSLGPSANLTVALDLQVMLRVAATCREDSGATGEIVGMEVTPGAVEATNCFAIPLRKDIWTPKDRVDLRELEEKHKREVEKYKNKLRELLHYVDADCQNVGWFQLMPSAGLNDPSIVEELFYRVSSIDRASFVLTFDAQRESPFQAFQITEKFFQLRKSLELHEITSQQYAKTLPAVEILREVPCTPLKSANSSALLFFSKLAGERARVVGEEHIRTQSVLDKQVKNLERLSATLDELAIEGDKLLKYQKDSSRYHQSLRRNLERKRVENEARRQAGEELAYDDEDQSALMLTNFERRIETPSYVRVSLMSRRMQK